MKKIVLCFITLCCFCFVQSKGAFAASLVLSGSADVNVTSDTSATAKDMAFEEARRQIIPDALKPYTNQEQLVDVVKQASKDDLINLVASSSIEGEKLSDTTYSAKISMVLDFEAVKKWLTDNDVQNWLGQENFENNFILLVVLNNKLADWIDIKRIARQEQLDLFTKYIVGNMISVELPAASRAKFTIALREAGWHYANQDGILRVWK